jgi:hypothetical protein
MTECGKLPTKARKADRSLVQAKSFLRSAVAFERGECRVALLSAAF